MYPTEFRMVCWALMLGAIAGCSEILDTHATEAGYSGPGSLVGPPPGDSISAAGNVNFNGGNLQLVASGSGSGSADLIPGGQPHNTGSYLINFSGVKLTITDTPVLRVAALGDRNRVACSLDIAGGEFTLNGGAGAVVAGPYTGAADLHRVLLRLDNRSERCLVNIRQYMQGSASPNDPQTLPAVDASVPYQTAGFSELDRVRVSWENVSRTDATSYFLGPMVISRQN